MCVLLLCSSFLAVGTTSLAAPALDRAGSALGGVGTSLINLGAGAAIGAVTGGMPGAAAGANIDWHNRQLHPSEAQRIQILAKQMAAQDQDGLHLNQEQWAQRLRLAAASRIDAKDNQTINTQLARTAWSNPLPITEDYLDSLNLAATVLQQEAAQNTPINWQDGSAIIADGAAVHAFQASDAQYRDHKLFGARDIPARMQPHIAEYTLSGSPTNMLPQIGRYGGQEQEHHQELLKIAGEHWKNRRHYDYEKILNHDYYAYTGTGEVRSSYPVLSLLGTGIGKASAWAGKKVLDKGLSRVAAKEARQVGGKGLFQFRRGEGVTNAGVSGKVADRVVGGDVLKSTGKNIKEGIYEFIDTSGKKYCGQSCNIPNRLSQHVKSRKLEPNQSISITEVLRGKTAREIAEHKRIQEITGGVPARFSDKVSNKIDPIGVNRKHLLND